MISGDNPTIGGPCPIGQYCPEGTSYPLNCPSGSYNNHTGQFNCTVCPSGYYCPDASITYEIHPCPVGVYCPEGTKYFNQHPCPRGYYRNLTHGSGLEDCFPCPGGYYCGGEGLHAPTGICSPGKFISIIFLNWLSCSVIPLAGLTNFLLLI